MNFQAGFVFLSDSVAILELVVYFTLSKTKPETL